jgi:Trypsin-co-occurring domain 2
MAQPQGTVGMSEALEGLRYELQRAAYLGRPQQLRFKPGPIEVTFEAAVTSAGKAKAGVRWWLIEAGAEGSLESAQTQKIKLTLNPVFFDATGQPTEQLVDDIDEPSQVQEDEQLLDDTS